MIRVWAPLHVAQTAYTGWKDGQTELRGMAARTEEGGEEQDLLVMEMTQFPTDPFTHTFSMWLLSSLIREKSGVVMVGSSPLPLKKSPWHL